MQQVRRRGERNWLASGGRRKSVSASEHDENYRSGRHHFTTPQLEQLSSTASLFSYVSTKACVCVCAVLIRNAAIDGKVMLGGISICPLTC